MTKHFIYIWYTRLGENKFKPGFILEHGCCTQTNILFLDNDGEIRGRQLLHEISEGGKIPEQRTMLKDISWKLHAFGSTDRGISWPLFPVGLSLATLRERQPTPGAFTKGFPNKQCLLISPWKEAKLFMFVFVPAHLESNEAIS